MRIRQLRFKNLNSLAGEWEIDLTHPAFTTDGIFAITGPTGAGKSTILDAVCLALYGRTPRLQKITKRGNEIMSRQTGECFAEVVFETQSGRYRCHWSQHRARRKSHGELQLPRHEIADADSGKVFETKIRGVAEQIEILTGMDFDRFTRSMLLAQGGFAAFLQAAPSERAPILEQITGTEIFSQISIHVHERRSDERKKLDRLQAKLAGMPLLTPEEEKQLGIGLEQNIRQDQEFNRQIEQKNQAVAWIKSITRAEKELVLLAREKADLETRTEAFAIENERLKRASRALELAAEHAALMAIRRAQETDQRLLHASRTSLPKCEKAAKLAEGHSTSAAEQFLAKKSEQLNAQPRIRTTRELDLTITAQDAPIQNAEDAIDDLTASLQTLCRRQDNDKAELELKRKAAADLRRELAAVQADEGLVEHLTGIRSRIDALQKLRAQLAVKLNAIKETDGQLQTATQAWQDLSAALQQQRHGLDGITDRIDAQQAALQKLLADADLSHWRQKQARLTAKQNLLSEAIEASEALVQLNQADGELSKQRAALHAEKSALINRLKSQTAKQAGLEQEIEDLETQLTLLKKIEDLETARAQLQDGEPCPLCGALEHPYAAGNIPAPDDTRQRLSSRRSRLKSVTASVAKLRVKAAETDKDIDQTALAQKVQAAQIEAAERLRVNACAGLSLDAVDPALDAKLKALQDDNCHALENAGRIIVDAEAAEKQLSRLRQSFEKTRETVVNAQQEAQAAAYRKTSASERLDQFSKEAADCRDQQIQDLLRLQKDLQTYGLEMLTMENLERVYAQLASRRDQWTGRQEQSAALDKQIAALELKTHHQADQIQKNEMDFKKQRKRRDELLEERTALVRKRRALFGDKSPDDEEARLAAAIESAEEKLESARQKAVAASQERSLLKSRIEELVATVDTRGIQQEAAEASFFKCLQKAGFADEEHYKSACLPESERKRLAKQSQKLADEKTELTAKEREKNKFLNTERQKRITAEPLDELKDALGGLIQKQRALQQEVGGIRQKLEENDALKKMQQERVQAIDAQKRECSRWDRLHELIGSADGKKYRNFAQGLTFEMMIGHANRQLQKMTDRYLLIRDDGQPLEINVVDNYQAGEIRSTKNLSGGEGFIVSLSLALGLSQMASQNVRVDSLFLDEGFGTLDEEALDTALETLAGLQQEGKIIGLISHVPALKERIATRIAVTPQTGGRGVLNGPGCRRRQPHKASGP